MRYSRRQYNLDPFHIFRLNPDWLAILLTGMTIGAACVLALLAFALDTPN